MAGDRKSRRRIRPTFRGVALTGAGCALTVISNIAALSIVGWAGALAFSVVAASTIWMTLFLGTFTTYRAFGVALPKAGESVLVSVSAQRNGLTPVPAASWEDRYAGYVISDDNQALIRAADVHEVMRYQAMFPARGIHQFGPVLCRWRDPFGIWAVSVRARTPDRVVVAPAVTPIQGAWATNSESAHRSSMKDAQMHLREPDATLRDYVRGDPMRRINWKASARTGDLKVRNDADDVGPPRIIVEIDASALHNSAPTERDEWAVAAAASLLSSATSNGYEAWLFLPTGETIRAKAYDATPVLMRLGLVHYEKDGADFLPPPGVYTTQTNDLHVVITDGAPTRGFTAKSSTRENRGTAISARTASVVVVPIPHDTSTSIDGVWASARAAGAVR